MELEAVVPKLKYPAVCRTHRAPTCQDVENLSKVRDAGGHAVSFYFKPGEEKLAERDAMIVNLRARDIISNSYGQEKPNLSLLRDLDAVMKIAEDADGPESPLKIVFACRERGIWEEFEIPTSNRIVRLEAANSFDLSLLRRLAQLNEPGRNSRPA